MIRLAPTDLQSLWRAFTHLENGRSVCLVSSEAVVPKEVPPEPDSALLGLYSSGSTGLPKLCWRAWNALKSELRTNPQNARWTWASPFSPLTFAGVQVALQAWASSSRIYTLGTDWHANWQLLAAENVHALSCTPTFLDLLLQHKSGTAWNPSQITLGGEPLRAPAGQRFLRSFPSARFSIIYASAELGILLKTNRLDGWYELDSLQRRYPEWRVCENELQVRHNETWTSPGDLVEIQNGLLRVTGRTRSVANVAGSKVNLDEISRVAEEVPGVRDARAFAEPNPVSGQIVCLRFTPEAGCDHHEVQHRLERHLRQNLRKEAWPRRWEIGPAELGANRKKRVP